VVPASLAVEGFVHCSTVVQVVATADRIFRGSGDLLVLVVDPDRLTAPLKWERATDVDAEFPHVYGPLDVAAVVETAVLVEGLAGLAGRGGTWLGWRAARALVRVRGVTCRQ
jgi:uncharacterized protein (DUF952 family)